MFYKIIYKPTKELVSLRKRFISEGHDENNHVFLINQTQEKLELILATVIISGIDFNLKHRIRKLLDMTLGLVIGEHIEEADFDFSEITQEIFLHRVIDGLDYLKDKTELRRIFENFSFELEESEINEPMIYEEISQQTFDKNIFIVNGDADQQNTVIRNLVHKLIEENRALSHHCYNVNIEDPNQLNMILVYGFKRLMNTLNGKILIIHLNPSQYFQYEREFDCSSFRDILQQLSLGIPIIVRLKRSISDHLLNRLSQQFNASVNELKT